MVENEYLFVVGMYSKNDSSSEKYSGFASEVFLKLVSDCCLVRLFKKI